ncbi:MAG: electron transport complex subunit RsxE [Gammaproteobacteria bacterium]|nr:electron transport complex subunit RsxE [Gammaproteobacteria bacterium]
MNQLSEGLLKNNPATVQLLGLCPLLAVSNTVVNAFGMAIATAITLILATALSAAIAPWVSKHTRIAVYVVLIAGLVSVIELLMQAYLPSLYLSLGLFLPLIVTNCIILGRIEAHATRNTIKNAAVNALGMSIGFGLILLVLGAVREFVGQASLFAGAGELLSMAAALEMQFEFTPALIALFPAGAFIVLAMIVALINWRQSGP